MCRRWRSVVFQSPRRLNLRLICTRKTPTSDTLDIWPPLPLIISDVDDTNGEPPETENIDAALEHNDRVCQIQLVNLSSSQLECVMNSAAMQKPFPKLTHLWLSGCVLDGQEVVLPDSFLGGTAPRLQSLGLYDIPFPGLVPKLLLSATRLVRLSLYAIPLFWRIPPEVMVTSLSALTSLESLCLHFLYPCIRRALDSQPFTGTRSILPSLTKILFKGASEYLEDILVRIDTPRLNLFDITFLNPAMMIFETEELFQFISRRPTEKGHITFNPKAITVTSETFDYIVPCVASEWQLSSLEQVCTSSLPPPSTLEDLYIFEDRGNPPRFQDDVGNLLWQELLHPFATVKNLYLCEKIVLHIAPALQEFVGGRTTEVLPTLENIFLERFQPSEPLHEGIEEFVAARRFTGHPVAVSRWDRDSDQDVHLQWEFRDW